MDTPVIHSERVRQPFSGYIMLAFILVLLAVLILNPSLSSIRGL
jgi:hypothetical protein